MSYSYEQPHLEVFEQEESKGDLPHLERETKLDDEDFASELQIQEVIRLSQIETARQRASLAKEKELQKIAKNEAIARSLQDLDEFQVRQCRADALEAQRLYQLEIQSLTDEACARALV